MRAWLQAALDTDRPLTLDLFRPNIALWRDFCRMTLELDRPLKNLAPYAALLNDYSAQLVALINRSLSLDEGPPGERPLGPLEPWSTSQRRQQGLSAILRELTRNNSKPWHTDLFRAEQTDYADAVAVAQQEKSNASQGASQRQLSLSDLPAEAQALAVPTYVLDSWIVQAQQAEATLADIRARLAAAEALHSPRRSSRRSTPSAKAQPLKPAASISKRGKRAQPDGEALIKGLKKQEEAVSKVLGGIATLFVQLCWGARASTIAGGTVLNPSGGIQDDLAFSEAGMAYIMRVMKGWTASTTHQGESLPLRHAGPNAFPWERSGSGDLLPIAESKRNAVLHIIRAAKDGSLLGWIDCDKPETQGNSRVNAFLKHIKATAELRPGHARVGGRRQSISSHSIRRAAVSMAMATGVRKDNLIRYVHWRDADMPYTYVDSNYEVRGTGWETFFSWLKDRVEQNA